MDIRLSVHAIVKSMAGIDAEEVTLVSVVRVFVFPVVEPLLEVAFLANLVGVQARQGGVDLGDKVAEHAESGEDVSGSDRRGCGSGEDDGGIAGIAETFTNHGDVGKTTETGAAMIAVWGDEGVLGRGGWGGDEI